MKKVWENAFLYVLLLAVVSCSPAAVTPPPVVPVDPFAGAGKEWAYVTNSGFYKTGFFSSDVFKGKIYMIGGFSAGYLGEVWHTADGSNWVMDTANYIPGTGIHYHQMVAFNNSLWLMGGVVTGGVVQSSVYSSGNGTNWSEANASAPWGARFLHGCVVFKNKIWLIGGFENFSGKLTNDVWFTSDGTNWSCANPNPPFPGRMNFGLIVKDSKLWLIGGRTNASDYMPTYSDVWCTSDGTNWTEVSSTAPFGNRQAFGCVSAGGNLWVIGGFYSAYSSTNDVWYSPDGVNWTCAATNAPFLARSNFEPEVFDNKIWVFAGYTDGGYCTNDVWTTP